ncbi:MAG: hypothetical protein GY866_25950 [Proteobacteria bacterium]|nr:hypothetical protein [Pseudomonadota bacterium]
MTDRFRRVYYEKLADRLYETREVPKNIEDAVRYYKKAMTFSDEKPGVSWKITRCYWVLATRSVDREEKLRYFKEGIRYGTIAITKDKSNSNAYLWYSLITGSNALEQGIMNMIYLRGKIKNALDTSLKLNPKNVNALVGLANWYYHVPAFLGGNKTKAFDLLEQALKIDPNYTAALIIKSEFLIGEKKYPQAVTTLKHIIRLDNPTLPGDGIEDKAKAGEMLDELKREGHPI